MGIKKPRTTPIEEREFIIAALEKEIVNLNKSAKEFAAKSGGYDYKQAVYFQNKADAFEEVIYTIRALD